MPLHHLQNPGANLPTTPVLTIALGAALLCAGKKLFWLFVAAVGFFGAMRLASEYLTDQPREWILIGSLLAGGLGAILAIFVQKVAVAIGGAVAGAYLLDLLFRSGVVEYPDHAWVFLLGAAVAGALLMTVVFRWALILLSSLAGAQLIAQMLPLRLEAMTAVFLILVLLGIGIQSRRKVTPTD